MLIVIGLVCVFAAVLGGYVLEHGNLLVLMQPAELLIICGAALGIVLISNPPRNIRQMLLGVRSLFRPQRYTTEFYASVLRMLYQLFNFARRTGGPELERQIERPDQSPLLRACPEFLNDAEACAFLCDSLRMAVAAGMGAPEMERLMGLDIEAQRRENHRPVNALSTLADALPGLGIVAAVLGVVVTMQALGGPASEIGQKVAAALVGTFLGILLCYGVVGPLAYHLECRNEGRNDFFHALRVGTVTFMTGASPLVAVEFARRSLPLAVRPDFDAMEKSLRRHGVQAEPAPAVSNA